MKKQKITRRILAAFCVVCIALLQCFVLMPAASDGVYADGSLKIVGHFDGKEQKDSYGGHVDGIVEDVLGDFDVPLSEIKKIWSDKGELSFDSEIIEEDGQYYIVVGTQQNEEGEEEIIKEKISKIEFEMVDGYSPIEKLYLNDIGKVKAGESKTLKYGTDYGVKSGDAFFKDKYKDLIKASTDADEDSISSDSITFTAGKAGTKVKVTIEDKITGTNQISKTANIVSKALTVSPTSLKLTVGRTGSITVSNDNGTISSSSSSLKWKSSNEKVATVSKGVVTGKKKGSATITVKDKDSGLSAKVTVKVTETKTQSTTRYSYSRPTYHTYRPTRSSNTIRTSGTGATRPTTATRPTETVSTAAPSFQTMKVKEVYLTPVEQDPYGGDEFGDEFTDEGTDENMDDENYDEDGVTFPAAAGSAAVAVAACGAGAVGRVRKFHIDMGDISSAKDIAAGGDGGMGGDGQSAETTGDAGDGEGKSSEKRSRNPLKKFRK